MELFPAIDLRDGQCVRLYQGDFQRETVYDADPVAVAARYRASGARWVHVVDLDAARTGTPVNRAVIRDIVGSLHPATRVEASGGIRDVAAAGALLDAGVDRLVVGTAALENPVFVRELSERCELAVGLDVRDGEVALRGWTQGSGVSITTALRNLGDIRLAAVIVTSIDRDGTLAGPDLDTLSLVLREADADVIASGGVGSLDDLRVLAGLDVGGRRLAGVIVGRALYEGRFTVEEAMAACAVCA